MMRLLANKTGLKQQCFSTRNEPMIIGRRYFFYLCLDKSSKKESYMTISYIPILKTKRAEFSALSLLDVFSKSKITPIFEIEPVPVDPDDGTADRTYNDILTDFGQKLATASQGISHIYLDGILIEESLIDAQDMYPITNAILQARSNGLRAIPVSSPTRTSVYLNAIDQIVQGEICLRLTPSELANPQIISNYINRLNISPSNIDIVIDLRDRLDEDEWNQNQNYVLAVGLVNNLPNLNQYRSVILAAGSFPVDLSNIAVGTYSQSRLEWVLWQRLQNGNDLERSVLYGDYGVQHPDYTRLATRFPSVSASIRYTGDNDFWIFRGQSANRHGYEQYGRHCQTIIQHSEYSGPTFSVGDQDINNYAQVYQQHVNNIGANHRFGSAEVWRKIGQNHHITKVVNQLSTLYGL
jgi:hypothetical protein